MGEYACLLRSENMFIRLLWENSQTFGMCGDLKKKEKMMLFKARVSKASRYFFLWAYVKTKRQSCCVTHQQREKIVNETLSVQNDRLTVSELTAVFGNPWEIFRFNCSIQLKTSEIWGDMKRKMIHLWLRCRDNRFNKRRFELFRRLSNPESCLNRIC